MTKSGNLLLWRAYCYTVDLSKEWTTHEFSNINRKDKARHSIINFYPLLHLADACIFICIKFHRVTLWLLQQGSSSRIMSYWSGYSSLHIDTVAKICKDLLVWRRMWWLSGTQDIDNIHLLPSLEGNMKICSTQKIHFARGQSLRETWIFWVEQIFMSPD